MKQWRICSTAGRTGSVVFIDAATEAQALAFFAAAFPSHRVVSVSLEMVDPCAQYVPRAGR